MNRDELTKVVAGILVLLILCFGIGLLVAFYEGYYQYYPLFFAALLVLFVADIVLVIQQYKRKRFGVIQSICLFVGIFAILICLFPLVSYYTEDNPNLDTSRVQEELLKLPYKDYGKYDKAYLITYKDNGTEPSTVKLRMKSTVESVNGHWAGTIRAKAEGGFNGQIPVDPNGQEKDWDDKITYKRSELFDPNVTLSIPLNASHRFKEFQVNLVAYIEYPFGLGKGMKFENRSEIVSNVFKFYTVSDEDLQFRRQVDKWKAVQHIGVERKEMFIFFAVCFVLFFLPCLIRKRF